jgi:hypothetical protein
MHRNVVFMVRAGIARVSNHEDQSIPVVRDGLSGLLTMKGMDKSRSC